MWALRQVSAFGIMRRTMAQAFRAGWPDSDTLLTGQCVRELAVPANGLRARSEAG